MTKPKATNRKEVGRFCVVHYQKGEAVAEQAKLYLNFSLLTPQCQFFTHPYPSGKAAALCAISVHYICPPGERREKGLLQKRILQQPLWH